MDIKTQTGGWIHVWYDGEVCRCVGGKRYMEDYSPPKRGSMLGDPCPGLPGNKLCAEGKVKDICLPVIVANSLKASEIGGAVWGIKHLAEALRERVSEIERVTSRDRKQDW